MSDLNVEVIRRAMIGGHDVQNVIDTLVAQNPRIESIELLHNGGEFPEVIIEYVQSYEPELYFDSNGVGHRT